MDKAQVFSLQYISAIEDALHFEWVDGVPTADIGRVNTITFQKLHENLRDIYAKPFIDEGVSGIGGYGGFQASPVGLAEDFDTFKKVGLILADRIVLWDAIYIQTFTNPSSTRLEAFMSLAAQLVELKPLVVAGGAVMLPHPKYWLERYQYYTRFFEGDLNVPTELLGLINAQALTEEKMGVSPYSWQPKFGVIEELSKSLDPRVSESEIRKNDLAYALQHLILHKKLPYLSQVSVLAFYETTRNDSFRKDLRKKLLVPPADPFDPAGTENREHAIRQLVEAFSNSIDEYSTNLAHRRKEVLGKSVEAAGGGFGAVHDCLFFAHDGSSLSSIITLIASLYGVTMGARELIRAIGNKPSEPIIYQMFAPLKEISEQEKAALLNLLPPGHNQE